MAPCLKSFAAIVTWTPDLTVDEMVQRIQGRMKEMHIPGFLAKRFTKDIPKLKRWAGK